MELSPCKVNSHSASQKNFPSLAEPEAMFTWDVGHTHGFTACFAHLLASNFTL
jgi:hypothetical protein